MAGLGYLGQKDRGGVEYIQKAYIGPNTEGEADGKT